MLPHFQRGASEDGDVPGLDLGCVHLSGLVGVVQVQLILALNNNEKKHTGARPLIFNMCFMHNSRSTMHQAHGAQLIGIQVIGFAVLTRQVDERFVAHGLLHRSPHCCRQGAQLLGVGHPRLPLFLLVICVPKDSTTIG